MTTNERIALRAVCAGPTDCGSLAALLPVAVGAKSREDRREKHRRDVASALLSALYEEGLASRTTKGVAPFPRHHTYTATDDGRARLAREERSAA